MLSQRLSQTLRTAAREQQQYLRFKLTPNFTPSPISSRTFAPAPSQRILGRRWYSQAQEAEAKKEEASGGSAAEQPKPAEEAQNEDPVQKELETKKREVIDVTVCPTTT